jgi:hypothetical protein
VYSQSDSSSRVPIDLRCCAPVERRRLCGELGLWFAKDGLMVDAVRGGWFVRAQGV